MWRSSAAPYLKKALYKGKFYDTKTNTNSGKQMNGFLKVHYAGKLQIEKNKHRTEDQKLKLNF